MKRENPSPNLRGDLTRQAFEQIRELIVTGKLSPGSRIVETELAERLGVSRGTVRPALQRLHHQGMVVAATPGRQSRLIVAPATREDARELYFLMGEIEGLAAWWAAQLDEERRGALVERMGEIARKIEAAAGRGALTPDAFLTDDRAFHGAFIDAGGGPRTRGLLDSLRPQLERYARIYATGAADHASESIEEHRLILRALEAGDPEKARNAVLTNWRQGSERLIRSIDARGEWGSW